MKIFCPTVPKNAVREPFSLSLISCIGNNGMRGWGDCQDFPSNTFCLTVLKNFAGHTLECHYFKVSKIFRLKGVMSRTYVEIFLNLSSESFRRGTLLCCVSEKF